MKESKPLKIKYKKSVKTNSYGDKEYEYSYVNASKSHTKRFNTAIMILVGIDGCERNLMDWISQNMTEGNYISNNEITRQNFIDFHIKYDKKAKKAYEDNTVNTAFQRLVDAGMLIRKARGLFMVNPFQYFKGDEEERIKAIRMIMEFKPNIETEINVEVDKK